MSEEILTSLIEVIAVSEQEKIPEKINRTMKKSAVFSIGKSLYRSEQQVAAGWFRYCCRESGVPGFKDYHKPAWG
ncbi:MAG TPA: hypothetical protein PLM07_21875 [Candidatus Rifleibacterium sp.]|nr:hypothetical protein [Candidatus Rifleibacterium sp.]HPT48543.1 hypothetical protein [Candidatus Rifleibacterium sp.]